MSAFSICIPYALGHQIDFKRALGQGKIVEARRMIDSIPSGMTPLEEFYRLKIQVRAYQVLMDYSNEITEKDIKDKADEASLKDSLRKIVGEGVEESEVLQMIRKGVGALKIAEEKIDFGSNRDLAAYLDSLVNMFEDHGITHLGDLETTLREVGAIEEFCPLESASGMLAEYKELERRTRA